MSRRARIAGAIGLATSAALACGLQDGGLPLSGVAPSVDASMDDSSSVTLDGGSAPSLDSLPTGAIGFSHSATCPAGWEAFAPAQGRAIVPVAGDPAVVGVTVGAPLAPGEDRLHAHGPLVGKGAPGSTAFLGITGSGNSGAAGSGAVSVTLATDAGPSGLPYVTLTVCTKKTTAPPAAAPVPKGLLQFFATTSCPTGWSQSSSTLGRHLVAVAGPDSGAPGAAFGGAPLAPGERRAHTHPVALSVNLPAHGLALISSGGSDFTSAGSFTLSGETDAAVGDVPYVQLLACKKD